MTVFLNNIPTQLPEEFMTIADLVEWKQIQPQGTAIAVNDKLIRQSLWATTNLNEHDQITVISAAFGG